MRSGREVRTGLLIMAFGFLIAWIVRYADDAFRRAGAVFCVAAVAMAVVAVCFYAADGVSPMRRLMAFGLGGNPVDAAVLFGSVLLIVLTNRHQIRERFGMITLALLCLPLAALIILTFSRGPWLAFAFAFLVLMYCEGRRMIIFLAAMLAVGVVALFLLGAFDDFEIVRRADSHRFEIWRDALAMVEKRLWFGYGIAAVTNFGGSDAVAGWKSSHNAYLGTVIYTGLVGLGLLVTLLIAVFWAAVRRLNRDPLCLMAITVLVYGLAIGVLNIRTFYVNAQQEWLVFWLPIAIIAGLELKDRLGDDPTAT